MLKRIKLKNSTILLIGICLIVLGVSLGFVEMFLAKKDSTFDTMNLMLFENETPEVINSEKEQEEKQNIDTPAENQNQQQNQTQTKYDYIGVLEIPKINLKRGFVDINSKYNNINYNITIINGSTMPDQENNNLILAAHSGACNICFFNQLYKLSLGDVAYVTYQGTRHNYKIVDIYEVEKDGTVAIHRDINKNVLTLITCTRNSDTKQTVYILEENN